LNRKINKIFFIRIIIAIVLLIFALIMYFLIHGCNNLLIKKFFTFISFFPCFKGLPFYDSFIKGHLVDILWFSSLYFFTSAFTSHIYLNAFLVLLFSIFMEFTQKIFLSIPNISIIERSYKDTLNSKDTI